MHHRIFDGSCLQANAVRIFLVDFLKILRLAQQRFRELEEEMSAPFFWTSYHRKRSPDEDALNLLIEQFKNTITDLKSDLMATADPSELSRALNYLVSAAMGENESSVITEQDDCLLCFPEEDDVINDLRKHKLTCGGFLRRCRRLGASNQSQHHLEQHSAEMGREGAALNVMCKHLISACTSLTHDLFAAYSESTTTMLQRITTFMIGHVAGKNCRWSHVLPGTAFGIYDCLGRTSAHQFFDLSNLSPKGEFATWQWPLLACTRLYTAGFDEQDSFGRTLLHIACQKHNVDVVGWLLRGGADPGLLTVYGHSPLHHAAAKGFVRICDKLLDHSDSFDIDQRDLLGYSARDYAEQNGFDEIIDLIDKALVDVDEWTTSSPQDHGSREGTPQSQVK
jgi:ankyrin repeat protein